MTENDLVTATPLPSTSTPSPASHTASARRRRRRGGFRTPPVAVNTPTTAPSTDISTPTTPSAPAASTSPRSTYPRRRGPRRSISTASAGGTPDATVPTTPASRPRRSNFSTHSNTPAQALITPANLLVLQSKLGVTFKNPALLLEAITHSSFAHEQPLLSPRDSERLEFLGDSVLQLAVANFLYVHHAHAAEGELSQTRSAMVNTFTLAHMAEQLDLGGYLHFGRTITTSSRHSLKDMLADCFEAVVGAIFLDAGYDTACSFYFSQFRALPAPTAPDTMIVRSARPPRATTPRNAPTANTPLGPDYKTALEPIIVNRFGAAPTYDSESFLLGEVREYTSLVFALGEPLATGSGTSEAQSEQDAARLAFVKLGLPLPVAPAPARPRPRRRRPSIKPTPSTTAVTSNPIAPPSIAPTSIAPTAPASASPAPASRQFGQ